MLSQKEGIHNTPTSQSKAKLMNDDGLKEKQKKGNNK
jgi:hypothetical protein